MFKMAVTFMTLQDFLYSLELGQGKSLLKKGVCVLLLILGTIFYMVSEFHGFSEKEAMDAAQVGREIAEGNGFTTQVIRPQAIGALQEKLKAKSDPKLENFPEIYQAPLYPYVLGTVFKITGKPYQSPLKNLRESPFLAEKIICLFNIFCLYLSALLILVLGARVFDARVGTLAAGLFVLSDLIWKFATSGLSTSFVILLLLLVWFLFNEAMISHESGNRGRIFLFSSLSGLALGLVILTRLSLFWILIPMIILYAIIFYQRKLAPLLFTACTLLLVIPFLIRNKAISDSFWGGWGINSLANTKSFALLDSQSLILPFKMIPIAMIQATGFFLTHFQGLLGGSIVAIIAFASLFHLYKRIRARVLIYGSFLLLPFVILAGSFVQPYPETLSAWNLSIILFPFFIIGGSAFFFVLLDRLHLSHPFMQKVVFWAFVTLNGVPLALTLAPPNDLPVRFPPYYPYIIRLVSEFHKPEEMIVSDMPWATAWYGDRPSVLLPQKIKDYFWIHDFIQPSTGFWMSPLTFDRKISEIKSPELSDYERLIVRSGTPERFPLPFGTGIPPKIAGGQDAYVYYSDRPRWTEKKSDASE